MRVLFTSYRLDQFTDPDSFKLNIGAVLEQYPIDTIRFVTDPRTGVQRRCSFPPLVKEVVDACDQHRASVAKAERFDNWGKSDEIEGPKASKPTLSELHERLGNTWGIGGRDYPDVARIRQLHAAGFLKTGQSYTVKQMVDISSTAKIGA